MSSVKANSESESFVYNDFQRSVMPGYMPQWIRFITFADKPYAPDSYWYINHSGINWLQYLVGSSGDDAMQSSEKMQKYNPVIIIGVFLDFSQNPILDSSLPIAF